MSVKFYALLKVEDRLLVDSFLFSSEMFRMMGACHSNPEVQRMQPTVEERIDYLRELYAKDLRSGENRFSNWKRDSKSILDGSLDFQRNFFGLTDGKFTMADYLQHLDLSYPMVALSR